MKIKTSQDLENVPNPQGRLDVLGYHLAKGYISNLGSEKGIPNLWDTLKPHVSEIITKGLSGLEIPSEAMVLLGLFQANAQPSIQSNNAIPDPSQGKGK